MLKFDYNESDFCCFRIVGQIRINQYLKLLFAYILLDWVKNSLLQILFWGEQ